MCFEMRIEEFGVGGDSSGEIGERHLCLISISDDRYSMDSRVQRRRDNSYSYI